MGQVPRFSSYLIIGDGRVARHFQHYFSLEQIPFLKWKRQDGRERLLELSSKSSHALLLINDHAIEPFLMENPFLKDLAICHFSGSLTSSRIPGAHPLMTFSRNSLYELQDYRRIPFVLEKGRATFSELLPGLRNQAFELEPSQKGLYHALCTLAGNFTVILWEKAFHEFKDKFGFDKDVLKPYLEQTMRNLLEAKSGESVLTGPLTRGDTSTTNKHMNELGDDPFAQVYASFIAAYERTSNDKVKT